jgi:hypothetical protein
MLIMIPLVLFLGLKNNHARFKFSKTDVPAMSAILTFRILATGNCDKYYYFDFFKIL